MGRRMSSALLPRGCALGFAFAIAFLALAAVIPAAKAAPNPVDPAAMTVTVVLDKSSYLSGDTASARAIVYRTPAPGNYTYVWRVRNLFFQLLNTTTTAGAVFNYPIALAYTGTLRFEATVDDGQGTVVAGQQSATVAQAYMSLTLDRGDYNPGDTISAFYGVRSHVITSPAYSYAVTDTNTVVVLSGTTNATFFSFATPNPSSRSYTFRVTATDRGNSTQALATINQATGFVLGMSFDRASYAAGETVQAGPTGSAFWSTEVAGFPVFAIVLSVLFLVLLVAVIGLWRRLGGGFGLLGGKAVPPPPPAEGPGPTSPTSPMSITCRRCGKPIDLSTSRRPIEVMCPSCGETQVVT